MLGYRGNERGVTIPNHVIAALDQLDAAERADVLAALWELQLRGASSLRDLPVRELAGAETVYVLRPAPRVRVIIRVAGNAPIEVLDIVRPETLRSMFRDR